MRKLLVWLWARNDGCENSNDHTIRLPIQSCIIVGFLEFSVASIKLSGIAVFVYAAQLDSNNGNSPCDEGPEKGRETVMEGPLSF